MTLLQDSDQASLLTDPAITVYTPDGRQQIVTPFKLGVPQYPSRRDVPGRPFSHAHQPHITPQGISLPPLPGTPISMPSQVKKMAHAALLPQPRISSNGGMRPPGLVVTGLQTTTTLPQISPTANGTSIVNGVNGIHRNAIAAVGRDNVKVENNSAMLIPNGTGGQSQTDGHTTPDATAISQIASPVRPKSQNQHPVSLPNGYHLTAINGYTALSNGSQFLPASTLSIQQMQNLKSAFAAASPSADLATNGARQLPYIGHVVPNGANFNLPLTPGTGMNIKLPPARQMQWSSTAMQRGNNGVDSSSINASLSPSPSHAHTLPVAPTRTPSAAGTRAGMRPPSVHPIGQAAGGHLHSMSLSPHQHNPIPLPSSLSQVQNSLSPRLPQPPTMPMVSPLLQQQPVVGNSQSGY